MDDTPKQAPGDLDPADIAILKEPIAGPLSWTAATFKFGSNIIPLSDTQLAALENLHAHRGDAPSLAAAKSSLGPVAASIIEHCENISGFALVRGVDVTRYATEQLKTMFFRFCGIVGNIVTQNSKGETLCEVTDANQGRMAGSNVRGYLTNEALSFHTDSSDILALFCEKVSENGGDSLVVSASTIYNELLARFREYLGLLYVGFFYDDRGQQKPAQLPAYRNAVFTCRDGKLACRYYLYDYVAPAYAKLALPLSPLEAHALRLFNAIAEDPANYVTFRMQPGDMVFYSNNNVLHARTAYKDPPGDEHQRRKLYRVWLNPHCPRALPATFARYRFGYH